MNSVKLGDTVYIVRGALHYPAEVIYSGDVHFTAGNCTYRRSDDEYIVGTHGRMGDAFASKEVYENWRKRRGVWYDINSKIRWFGEDPPAHLSTEQLQAIYKLLTGKE